MRLGAEPGRPDNVPFTCAHAIFEMNQGGIRRGELNRQVEAVDGKIRRHVYTQWLTPGEFADIFAKLGLISWDADIRAAFDDLEEHDSDSGTDATWGVGVALRLGSFAVRAEAERFEIGDADKVYMFSVGGTFTF